MASSPDMTADFFPSPENSEAIVLAVEIIFERNGFPNG
jgi:hypothetical protein